MFTVPLKNASQNVLIKDLELYRTKIVYAKIKSHKW